MTQTNDYEPIPPAAKFGQELEKLREANKISRSQMARILNVTPAYVWTLEVAHLHTGERRYSFTPSEKIVNAARQFFVDLAEGRATIPPSGHTKTKVEPPVPAQPIQPTRPATQNPAPRLTAEQFVTDLADRLQHNEFTATQIRLMRGMLSSVTTYSDSKEQHQ